MKQFTSTIISNKQIADSFFELKFTWDISDIPIPGQFLTIRVSESSMPLLRRPFAFSEYNSKEKTASIIYQKRGKATETLVANTTNDSLGIIGPLGKSFPKPSTNEAIVVAGGIGVGPILFLASTLRESNVNCTFIFGCRTKTFIPDLELFRQLSPVICTDDGSMGFKGTTADYLKSVKDSIPSNSTLYSCGPTPMLKSCHEFAKAKSLPCYVSVEQIMACGVGACMGCVVKINEEPGYARACKDGPVFPGDFIKWE
jgi:dihydroorotate dehydrogenase electron transfer subunit